MFDTAKRWMVGARPAALGVLFGALVSASSAQAGLVGSQLTFTVHRYFGVEYSTTGIAGTDAFTIVFGGGNVHFVPTFSGNSITIGLAVDGFQGWAFGPGDWISFSGFEPTVQSIASASLVDTVYDSGLTPSDLSWTASSVKLDISDVMFRKTETIRLDLAFGPPISPAVTTVPEPAPLALLGAAGLGLAWMRRRRSPGERI